MSRPTARRHGLRALLAAGVAAALAGCVAIPTSGPVVRGDVQVDTAGDIDVLAEGPRPGASPVQIVDGFLLAGAVGFLGEFVTAREYLTGPVAQEWKPLDGVVVAGTITYGQPSEDVITLDIPVLARVDAEGRYAEAPPNASEQVTFELAEDDDGEWRIEDAPDGLILPQAVFDQQFRSSTLYFLSPDETFLVPEVRWFPARNLPTSVARAVLAGPSPWLRDAVLTAVPDGVVLNPEAVPVDKRSGVALVGLDPPSAVLAADRPQLLAQIETSLLGLSGVGSVQVTTGGVLLDGAATLERGELLSPPLEYLKDRRLMTLEDGEPVPVAGIDALPKGAHEPARNGDGSVRVVLTADRLMTVPWGGDPGTTLVTGTGLVGPSVDRFDWVWTARATEGVVAVQVGGEPVDVSADFLLGRAIRSLRVSHDGTRIAVVSVGADGVTVDVAGIVRDASGTPQGLGEPLRVGASLVDATEVVWTDESTLGVVGRSTGGVAVHEVPVSGPTRVLPEVPDLQSIAGSSVLYVTTADGALRRLVGPTWTVVDGVEDASDPTYPG